MLIDSSRFRVVFHFCLRLCIGPVVFVMFSCFALHSAQQRNLEQTKIVRNKSGALCCQIATAQVTNIGNPILFNSVRKDERPKASKLPSCFFETRTFRVLRNLASDLLTTFGSERRKKGA